MNTSDSIIKRERRTRIFRYTVGLCTLVVGVYILLALQSLILPVVLGMLSAYLCVPLLARWRRNGIPQGVGIMILFGAFILVVFFLARQVTNLIPDQQDELELRVNIMNKANMHYMDYMGLDEPGGTGNMMYELIGNETNPMMDSFNSAIMLSEAERNLFETYFENEGVVIPDVERERILGYYESMLNMRFYAEPDVRLVERELAEPGDEEFEEEEEPEQQTSIIGVIIHIISVWLVMPVVFLFLLVDDGKLKKSLVSVIPNNYFEMSLTTLANVDRAIGNYLRGTLIESLLMAVTIWILLVLIGFDYGVAVVLAMISGLANAIPFFGSVIGLVVCAGYALIMDDVNSVLPFITVDNLILAAAIVIVISQAIDNAYFKPYVLGKAVDLHPIIVFIGAIGGSMMFGFVGLLFAIPVIVIIKEIYGTLNQQLKEYFIIY